MDSSTANPLFSRSAGILLHPTSLPSKGGIGDLGPAALEFVDFLKASKISLWQVLPLNPVGYGNSPYSATSAFAFNPLLISLERLAEHGWLTAKEAELPIGKGRVNFDDVAKTKLPLLRKAARNFLKKPPDEFGEHARFEQFTKENSWWLEDFALFNVLREKSGFKSWNDWPKELAARHPEAIARSRAEHEQEFAVERVLQFAFFEQWKALREYCKAAGVRIIGDVAIFVNYDSADVWTNPDLFYLDENLDPTVVSGVPPDAFSDTGQRWGNPLYRWDVLKQRGYQWWIARMRMALQAFDYVRLDHFRGFDQYWEIPAAEPTAINGKWVDGPRDDLFHALRGALGELPFIAEDLGTITPPVERLRLNAGMPGMKILQFGFGDRGAHIYLPHKYEERCVCYTGTHDNDTTLGWWNSLDEKEREPVRAFAGEAKDGMHWALVRAAYTSPACFAIVPLQDVLGLDSSARMNTPSEADGNWGWRYEAGALKAELAKKLATLAEVCDRDGVTQPS